MENKHDPQPDLQQPRSEDPIAVQKDIESIVQSLFKSMNDDAKKWYQPFKDHPSLQDARDALKKSDPEEFNIFTKYKFEEFIFGMVASELKPVDTSKLLFLINNFEFIENHFETVIVVAQTKHEQFFGRFSIFS